MTGFDVVTERARSTAARLAAGIGRLNWIMIGAATPTVWPSPIVVVAVTYFFGETVGTCR